MLQEAQEEVKSLRSRSLPNSTVSRYGAPSLLPVVSPAAGFGWGGGSVHPPFPKSSSILCLFRTRWQLRSRGR